VIFVVIEELRNVANLATERRSSKASKDEDQRFALSAFADVETGFSIERHKRGVRGIATDFQVATMHMRQGIADHAYGVFRATRHVAEASEYGNKEDRETNQGPFQDGMQKFISEHPK
jgi:hypothetical protein